MKRYMKPIAIENTMISKDNYLNQVIGIQGSYDVKDLEEEDEVVIGGDEVKEMNQMNQDFNSTLW